MQIFLPLAALVTIAVITPGPNNFVVLRAGARDGLSGAMYLALGVIGGTLVLLALVWSGAGLVLADTPALRQGLASLGALYLIWLGVGLLRSGDGRGDPLGSVPETPGALAVFQLLNPKTWVLVTTAVAATPTGVEGLVGLALLLCVVSAACLSLWAVAGVAISPYLERPLLRRWFDRVMGTVLVASAVALILALNP